MHTLTAIVTSIAVASYSFACPADITGPDGAPDGTVDVFDLLHVIEHWGPCEGCPADLTGSGIVNVHDLLIVIDQWGEDCPMTQIATITYDKVGEFDFVVPEGVESITLKATGAGAYNSSSTTARHVGSSGGAYSQANDVPVTPGETLTVRVAESASNGTEGAHHTMAAWVQRAETNLVYAEGGRTGAGSVPAGGRAANGVGDITFSGGAGGNRSGNAGGGGGGAATADGDGADGGDASGSTPGDGGLDGSGNPSGGDGGAPEEVGGAGTAPGGGTGGKGSTAAAQSSPPGGVGQVVIEMELPDVVAQDQLPQQIINTINAERVAYAMIGDSNITFGGTTGHYQGMEKALHQKFGVHGFGRRPAGTNVGAMGAFYNGVRARNLEGDDVLSGDDESVPSELRDFIDGATHGGFGALLDGDTVSVTSSRQLDIRQAGDITNPSLFGVKEAMRFYLQLGVWKNEDASGGNPQVRLNVAEDETTINENVLDPGDTLDDDYGVTTITVDIPADASRTQRLRVRYWEHGNAGSQLTGPFYAMHLWGELIDVTSGPLVTHFRQNGGMGLRESMQELEDITDLAIENRIGLMKTTLPESNPKIIFHIAHGGNDRSDDDPSWGGSDWDSDYPGNSAVGFRNNLKHMMDYVIARAEAAGFDADDIYFLLTYHPQPPHVQTLANFEGGASMLTPDYNLIIVRGTAITTPEEMTANEWYNSWDGEEGDHAHLSQDGYEGYNALVLGALPDPIPGAVTFSTPVQITKPANLPDGTDAGDTGWSNIGNLSGEPDGNNAASDGFIGVTDFAAMTATPDQTVANGLDSLTFDVRTFWISNPAKIIAVVAWLDGDVIAAQSLDIPITNSSSNHKVTIGLSGHTWTEGDIAKLNNGDMQIGLAWQDTGEGGSGVFVNAFHNGVIEQAVAGVVGVWLDGVWFDETWMDGVWFPDTRGPV